MTRLQNYLTEQTQKELIIAIGLPASGKSTYIKKNYQKHLIVSNDLTVEKLAKKSNTDYNAAFDQLGLQKIIKQGHIDFKKALKTNRDIVLDNTNLTKAIRKQYIDLANDYHITALVFNISEKEQYNRLAKRKGKNIPKEILDKMRSEYEAPTKQEGFHEIIKK